VIFIDIDDDILVRNSGTLDKYDQRWLWK